MRRYTAVYHSGVSIDLVAIASSYEKVYSSTTVYHSGVFIDLAAIASTYEKVYSSISFRSLY